ncbi:hypothetical protein FVE85_3446 [Porphyridium purpureum]|uniref:Uncharacterized protein n=1 Tax=Porphyridium purpureum TaxID=35688 RepID=A0A5J4YGI4_PORPP|nr:hypothetical protein FVE85_3446 [Porphyridium purpureum]|eukprot:POR2772..scf228_30
MARQALDAEDSVGDDDDFFGPQYGTPPGRDGGLDLAEVRKRLEKQGFRDALSAYSEHTAQTGFDCGFSSAVRDTERAARVLGTIEAVLSCSPAVNSTKWPFAAFVLDAEQRNVLESCRAALRIVERSHMSCVKHVAVAAAENEFHARHHDPAGAQEDAPTLCSCGDSLARAHAIHVERMLLESRSITESAERILTALGLFP